MVGRKRGYYAEGAMIISMKNRRQFVGGWRYRLAGLTISSASLLAAKAQSAISTGTNSVAMAADAPASRNVWLTFGLDRFEWLQMRWLGNPLWQYLAALIFILLAFCAAKLVDFVFRMQLKRLTARTKSTLDDLVVDLARGPVKIITFVVLLHVGLRAFAWPEWAVSFISNGLTVVIAGSITYVAIKLVDLGMGLWRKRMEVGEDTLLDKQLFPVVSKSLKVFVVVVAVLVTTQNLGMNVTGLLASLSIGGLATMPFMNSEQLNGLVCKPPGRGGRYFFAGAANC